MTPFAYNSRRPSATAPDALPFFPLASAEIFLARQRCGIGVAGGVVSQIALISIIAGKLADGLPETA